MSCHQAGVALKGCFRSSDDTTMSNFMLPGNRIGWRNFTALRGFAYDSRCHLRRQLTANNSRQLARNAVYTAIARFSLRTPAIARLAQMSMGMSARRRNQPPGHNSQGWTNPNSSKEISAIAQAASNSV